MSTLAGSDNGKGPNPTPTPPPPPPGQVQVSSVSPKSVVAGGPSFTLTVNGLNFLPSTTVMWNDDFPLTTTYISSTVLKAQVPASLVARADSVSIAPSPVGTFNWVGVFTVTAAPIKGNSSFSASSIPVQANDIAWNPVDQRFYLSVASADGTNANTITALDPQTGTLGPSVSTGSEPGALAISSDGNYIYAGGQTGSVVQRYTLPALQHDIDIPLGSGTTGPYYAIDIEVQPGSPHTVAISKGIRGRIPRELGGVLIYDDAVPRPQSIPGFGVHQWSIDGLLWNPNGQVLYGFDDEFGTGLYLMPVTSDGAQLQATTQGAGTSLGNHLHFDKGTGYIYTDSGKVIEPNTMSAIGSYPLAAVDGGFNGGCAMATDSQLKIAYCAGLIADINGPYVIEAFDLTNFTLLGTIQLPNMSGKPTRMIRWGSNGLAILTTPGFGGPGGVYLVSGAFVTSPTP